MGKIHGYFSFTAVRDEYNQLSPGVAKVRPSQDFLQPLCQILDAQLSYL